MLSREEALQWCTKHLVEWPEVKPSIAPDGWKWLQGELTGIIFLTNNSNTAQIVETSYDLHKERVKEFKTFISDTHSINKLKPFDHRCRSTVDPTMITKSYRNQFTPSSFSFNYLMKNVHKMARP